MKKALIEKCKAEIEAKKDSIEQEMVNFG